MTTQPNTRQGTNFENFVASGYGRVGRVALGLGLITVGLAFASRPAGFVLAAFGLIPLATGVFNLCPIAPIWGGHFVGSRYCAQKGAGGPSGVN